MIARISLTLMLATSASCAIGAPSASDSGFDNKVVVLLAAMIDDQVKAKNMIHEVRLMDFQSGRTQVSDFAAFSRISKQFKSSELQLRGTDALLLMNSSSVGEKPCRDRLSVNFYPSGNKLDVTYAFESGAVCSQPVEQVLPAPVSDATGE